MQDGRAGNRSRHPTMRQVAERAGVAMKTVSRVVNGAPGVSAETAGRVRQAIAEMGFLPNDLARSLVWGGRSGTIALLIKDLGNPFYWVIARATERVVRERGSLLIIGSSEGD